MKDIPKTLSLSADDVVAILEALQLIPFSLADSFEAQMRNELTAEFATRKLLAADPKFSSNEILVTYVAVSLARDYLSGRTSDLLDSARISAKQREALSPHLFAYNRLYPLLAQACMQAEFE